MSTVFLESVNSEPSPNPNYASATGSALFFDYSHPATDSLTSAEVNALVNGGVGEALVEASAFFINDPAFISLFTDTFIEALEPDFEAISDSVTEVTAEFKIAANESLSFDFTADLDLEAKEIEEKEKEFSQAQSKTTFVVLDIDDINNPEVLDYFGVNGELISSREIGTVKWGNSSNITLSGSDEFTDVGGDNGEDFVSASATGSYSRTFSPATHISIVQINASFAQVITREENFFNALGDFVFEDLNANGIQDANEPGIAGAEVTLQDSSGTTLATKTTDANGFYEFISLFPGDYKVMFTQPTGFDAVSPFFVGPNRAIDSDANPNNGLMSPVVNLEGSEFDQSIDAGFYKFAKLGDFVFNDLDQDGIQDSNEPGIAGAEVKLQDPNGTTLATTTTTDGNGMYMFGGLTPGDYKVMFTQPSGFDGVSPFQAGNNPAIDSDANPNNGLMSDVVTLSSGENNNTIDAGFFQSVNPAVDIEKLVRVQPPSSGGGVGQDLCDTEGKPHVLVFDYLPGNTVNTAQNSDKARINFNSGIDDDGTSFVIVTNEDKANEALQGKGKQFFNGEVSFDEEFSASIFNASTDKFESKTFIHFFDDQSGGLLQTIEYHTSCSQPIQLGDEIGNATLVGYDGKDGSLITLPDPVFVDADNPPGPEALIGTVVDFRYEVINTGDTPLNNIIVTDNRLSNLSFDGGDNNNNNQLDLDETWIYSASETATEGLQTNKGTVTAVDSVTGQDLMAMDPANYTGIEQPAPQGDVCDTLGKPREIMFEYNPGTDVLTGQKSDKARINFNGGVDDDGTSFVIVTNEDKANEALQGKGKQFFAGDVSFDEEFSASIFNASTDKFESKTFIHFFDDQSGGLLQTIEYHTSCSQPIQLGDIIGNVELVGYVGEDGSFI